MPHSTPRRAFASSLLLLPVFSLLYAAVASACDPSSISSSEMGAIRYEWGTVEWREPSADHAARHADHVTGATGGAGCPEPSCVPDDECITYETETAFVRPSDTAESPVYVPPVTGSYCFSVAKMNDSSYYHLHAVGANPDTGEPGGFQYSTSTDGISWALGDLAFPNTGSWFSGIICPDPHFLDQSGNMGLYFQGGQNGIGYATSDDFGMTFVDSGNPVLESENPEDYIVRTPSVVKLGNLYYMAYNLVCAEPGSAPFVLSTLNLATSPNGVDWTELSTNPILIPGECDQFDRGATALGQLVADPDGSTLHLFYTGAGWMADPSGEGTTRGCFKIGHAISVDGGRNWCKSGSPVLDHPPAGSGAWDTSQYMVSDYTWETDVLDQDVLRMYYWASYPDDPTGEGFGLGVAEATAVPGCATSNVDHSGTPYQPRVVLQAHPNPSSGPVRILHDLRSRERLGTGTLSVYNMQGQRVRVVWSGSLASAPREFTWNGQTDRDAAVAAGRYLLRLDSQGATIGATWATVLR